MSQVIWLNGCRTNEQRLLGIVEKQDPARAEYNPGHPLANEEGYIFMPNVNVIEEMANMISVVVLPHCKMDSHWSTLHKATIAQ